MQTLPQLLPPAEMGTAHTENTVTNTTTLAFDTIQYWMESGYSQLLSREQSLLIASWGLKIAGQKNLQHQVLAELVELPENYG